MSRYDVIDIIYDVIDIMSDVCFLSRNDPFAVQLYEKHHNRPPEELYPDEDPSEVEESAIDHSRGLTPWRPASSSNPMIEQSNSVRLASSSSIIRPSGSSTPASEVVLRCIPHKG